VARAEVVRDVAQGGELGGLAGSGVDAFRLRIDRLS